MAKNLVKVTDMLYAHEWRGTQCHCGWAPTPLELRTTDTLFDDHVDHVAKEMDKAGLLA